MRVENQMSKNVTFLWNYKVWCRPQQSKQILLSKNYVQKALSISKTNWSFKEPNLQTRIRKKNRKIILRNSMTCRDPIHKKSIQHLPKSHLQTKKRRSFTSITSAFKRPKTITMAFRKETTFWSFYKNTKNSCFPNSKIAKILTLTLWKRINQTISQILKTFIHQRIWSAKKSYLRILTKCFWKN